MPIFRINDQLHYFAHVPKCGGTSVETYLRDRFGPMALDEPDRRQVPEALLWNRGSTHHIPVFALDRIIPPDWFASSFAIVRHPVRRLISAFFFARDFMRQMPLGTDFNAWFRDAATWIDTKPFHYNGHLLPQSAIVPEAARIFRFEDGLEQVVPYLDGLAGNSDGPRDLPTRNIGRWRAEEAPPEPSAETLDLVAKIYAADFVRFGYASPGSVADASALPDLPVLAATGQPPIPTRRPFMNRLHRSLLRKAGQ